MATAFLLVWLNAAVGVSASANHRRRLLTMEAAIVDIGDWVFNQAALQVQAWRNNFHPQFQISINKSPVQFQPQTEAADWVAHLDAIRLGPRCINVEITEGLLLDASTMVTDKLLQLRDAGIQVALDDFGTGYSSLSYLNKFDIDYLKIDRSFVRNLAPDSSDLALSEAIIVMAHKLGLKVIAEGVETAQQRGDHMAAEIDRRVQAQLAARAAATA